MVKYYQLFLKCQASPVLMPRYTDKDAHIGRGGISRRDDHIGQGDFRYLAMKSIGLTDKPKEKCCHKERPKRNCVFHVVYRVKRNALLRHRCCKTSILFHMGILSKIYRLSSLPFR